MAGSMRTDHRISVGLPEWLYEDLRKLAEAGGPGWDVSKQVRYELLALRGRAQTPSLPQVPSYDSTNRTRKNH